MTNELRYQFAPWHVKLWRWLLYRPFAYLRGAWWCLRYCRYRDDFIETHRQCIAHFWTVSMAMAEFRMRYYWTTDELIQQLRGEQP